MTAKNKSSAKTGKRRHHRWILSVIGAALVLASLYFGMGGMRCGTATKAKANIGTLQALLMQYSVKFSGYPSEEQGLRALFTGGITEDESLLTDPWGEPVRYCVPGVRSGDKFDLYSTGGDEIDGTDDDIGNWEEVSKERPSEKPSRASAANRRK